MIAEGTDLQDNRFWKRMYQKISQLSSTTFKQEYVDLAFPPCHDLQDNTFQPASYFNYFLNDASGQAVYRDLRNVINPLGVPIFQAGADPFSGPISFKTSQGLDLSISGATHGLFIHFAEPDLWARLDESSPYGFISGGILWKLTYTLRNHANKTVPLQDGWHVDKIRSWNWSLQEIHKIWQIFNYPPFSNPEKEWTQTGLQTVGRRGFSNSFVVRTPRIIRNVLDRWWLVSPIEIFYGLDYGALSDAYYAKKPAKAGMKALRIPGYEVSFVRGVLTWQQDLNVYQFNGKVWKPIKEIHGKTVHPDVLDSTSRDPNFLYDLMDYVDPQCYFGSTAYNSMGL